MLPGLELPGRLGRCGRLLELPVDGREPWLPVVGRELELPVVGREPWLPVDGRVVVPEWRSRDGDRRFWASTGGMTRMPHTKATDSNRKNLLMVKNLFSL